MALIPNDDAHLAQINAGTVGRKSGHTFEKQLAADLNLNTTASEASISLGLTGYVVRGSPAIELLKRIIVTKGQCVMDQACLYNVLRLFGAGFLCIRRSRCIGIIKSCIKDLATANLAHTAFQPLQAATGVIRVN